MSKGKSPKSRPIDPPGAGAPDADTAAAAIRTLIRYIGDDPDRAGLRNTPDRVLAFYRDFFAGYRRTPADYARGIANDVAYDDFILIRDIALVSFCEHHMLPATGLAHIAYFPGEAAPGLGSIARIAADCAARLTTQEALTDAILETIDAAFAPAGIAVQIRLSHGCMTLRGPRQPDSEAVTLKFTGLFARDPQLQQRFVMLSAPLDRAADRANSGPCN